MQRLRRGLLLALLGSVLPAAAEEAAGGRGETGGEPHAVSGLSAQEQARYFQQLRRLYPRKSERQMLLEHCNRLLETHALRAGYSDRTQRLLDDHLFSLSVSAPGELTIRSELRSGDGSELQVRSQRLSLYGLDPFVRYHCPPRGLSCAVLDPRDGSELLVLLRDPSGVSELTRALSYLIRDLQRD